MKKMTRLICSLLVVLMLLSVVPITGVSALEKDESVDFVIVLDCSASLFYHDRERLCLNACESFMDQLPVQDARVGVIGFGYGGGNPFPYSSKYTGQTEGSLDMSRDATHVHEILPLSDLSGETRENYKKTVISAVDNAWRVNATSTSLYSPVVPAIGAAVDMLERSGAADNNACIILISDGVSYTKGNQIDPTVVGRQANEHGWPIYCIELNYATPDRKDVQKAQKLMDEICAASGDRNVAREYCASPEDVFVAFQRIFYDLWKYPAPLPEDWPQRLRLPGDFPVTIPVLTSEATVNVFGNSMESVTLTDPDGKEITITGNYERDDLIAVVEDGKYYSIKMICPKDGVWNCHVEGQGDASVLVNSTDLQEMSLAIVANAQSSSEILRKNDVIRVDAFFAYRGHEVHNHEIYQQTYKNAKLRVQHSKGITKEYEMSADSQGYICELTLNEFPEGVLSLQVILEDNMFRSGKKVSDVVSFKTGNVELELTGNGPESKKGYVNNVFDRIDLSEIFHNPDEDLITYSLECDDRVHSFDFSVDADNMLIETGMEPGTYPVTISAKDPDMIMALEYSMELVVENRAMEKSKIKDVELWIDSYGFQKAGDKEKISLDLDQYVTDPDGVDIKYTVTVDESIVKLNQKESIIELVPVSMNETVVTVVANDGVEETQLEFKAVVMSGKTAFWRDNWIYFVIALAILILIVLVTIILIKNKRVKGEWEIIIDDNGESGKIDRMSIADYTAVGKKGKFLLKDLIVELVPYMDYPLAMASVMSYFSGNGAEKIELVGTTRKKGCNISKIPANGSGVTVAINGVNCKGKAKIFGGTLMVVFDQQTTGARMVITMRLY